MKVEASKDPCEKMEPGRILDSVFMNKTHCNGFGLLQEEKNAGHRAIL
jgi:hypothetical protein